MLDVSPQLYEAIEDLFGEIPIDKVPHEEFKRRTQSAVAVVRTGEFTPYANIILVAGVVF
jgi:D-ribose pyranase